VWIANLWGIADLLNAYYKGTTQVMDVGLFSAGIYVPALFVPILLIAHVLAFRLLLKPSEAKVQNGNLLAAKDLSHRFAARPE
jgi:fumarate reductase subunit D